MKPPKPQRLQSILGLDLAAGHLRACRVARNKGGVEVTRAADAPLSLDLLHPDPELVGREIKNHLDAAGLRERNCVVALPPRWVMTQHAKIPDLSAEDAASFLQLEAERGFPVDPAQLQIAQSFQKAGGVTWVTQLAVRKEQLDQLSRVLKAAGLRAVSYSLGLTVLPGTIPADPAGRITVAIDAAGVTLLAAAGGGLAAFRTCDASIESENGEKLINAAAVARELRITFEQIPPELRAEIRQLHLEGDSTMVRQFAEAIADWAHAAGLTLSRGDLPEKHLGAETAKQVATRALQSGVDLEFLPPHPSRWSLLMARYSSRRLATAGFAAGAAAVLVLLAFGWLEFRRWSLRSEWSAMQAQVAALENVQGRIREFRPFYDTSFRTLTILKRVTECFPDTGNVTAKTFEVHGNTIVTISGTARDNASLLRVQEQLRKAREVQGLKIEQIRGKTPAQFTLIFRWNSNPAGS
ncbi:MAG: hypothetical protein HZA93_13780 [Verrucomicrobia bacterium]|nr:hypothetical protein [Verrucomicrobiota bacterium]